LAEPATAPLQESPERAVYDPAPFRWFGAGIGSWFGGFGIQSVVFAHLLTNELGISAEQLGIAQSINMLPTLALLLIGGAFVDRRDPRRVLVVAHLLSCVPVLLLAWSFAAGELHYWGVIACGIALGIVGSFAMPARDSQLSHVAGSTMLRAVTMMTILQFAAQAVGSLAGGEGAHLIGVFEIMAFQAALLAAGALFTLRIPPSPPMPREVHRSTWHDVADGVRIVARTPELRAPIFLVLAVSACFIGPFMVVFPLMVRDFYQGGARELGWVMAMVPVGTIFGSLAMVALGVRMRGRAALIALASGAVVLFVIGQGLPFAGMLALTAIWGICGAVFINCSRAMFQEAAPAAHRARALSVYQLCFSGAGPFGMLVAGVASGAIGPLATVQSFAVSMLVVVTAIWTLTTTARMR
jgi:MFS family permease